MNVRFRNETRRAGSTLLTVVVLVGALTVLTLVFLRIGQRVTDEQLATVESARAAYLAEAGIAEALEALRSGKSGNVGQSDDPAYLGGGVVWVTATDLGGGRTQLDSLAMKDSGRAALRVVVENAAGGGGGSGGGSGGGDGFFHMLFSNKHLQLDQDIVIDSYDSSLGSYASQATNSYGGTSYAGSNAGASGNSTVQLDANVKVFGDVHSGPSDSVGMSGGAYVSGSTTPNPDTVPLEPITVPVIAASGAYNVPNNQTKTLNSGTYHFTNVTMGKSSKLVINGPATLVWDGFTAGQQATLNVDCTGGPVVIYDTGVWSVDKNFVVGPVPGSPVDAAFLISSTGTVEFDQGSQIFVGFYAPEAKIDVKQGAEVWGALVANEIEVNQTTRFHFDENLKNFKLPWDVPDSVLGTTSGSEPEIVSWMKTDFPVELYAADRRDPFTVLGVKKAALRSPAEAWEDTESK